MKPKLMNLLNYKSAPMKIYLKHIGILSVFLCWNFVSAQDDKLGTKVIDIVKPYSPTIKSVVKQVPPVPAKDTTIVQKKKINYTIFSVPVASVFVPEKGRAMLIPPKEPNQELNSYFSLGGGNYASLFADGYVRFSLNEVSHLFADIQHNSSQKGVKIANTDSNFSKTETSVGYRFSDEYYQGGASLHLGHRLSHWYGLENTDFLKYASFPLAQNYWKISAKGYFGTANSFFKRSDVFFHQFSDGSSSKEYHFGITPSFEFLIGENPLILTAEIDYLNANFEKDFQFLNEISNRNVIIGVNPSYQFSIENFTISAGLSFYNINTNVGNSFKILPNAEVNYQGFSDYFIPYAGIKNHVKQNSYRHFSEENPFVSPTLFVVPTTTLFNTFVGAKGRISNGIGYDVKGGFSRQENIALFKENDSAPLLKKRYHLDNSFNVLYDNASIFDVSATIGGEIFSNFSAVFLLNARSYAMDNQPYAWHLPSVEGSLWASYHFLKNWTISADIFYTGQRKAQQNAITSTLPSFFDANIQAQYQINKRWRAFIKTNNLSGNRYYRFANYPTQGFQILAGATYQFRLNK